MAAPPCIIVLTLFLLQLATSALSLPLLPHHNNITRHSHFAKNHRPRPQNRSGCSLFEGAWVRDETYPLYRPSDCGGVIDREFDCQTYGRPDSDYLKFRWQPFSCRIPRFNGVKFLSEMRGKTVMFVGDSLGRNQWESLICMITASAPSIHTQFINKDPLSTFKFLDYGVKVSFYRAPYLVDIEEEQGRRILKLDKISGYASATWRSADVLLFNTGHWWIHRGSLRGWDKMETGGISYGDMDRLEALGKGLRTWADWAHRHIDPTLTRLFFFSVSPTHYNPSEWMSRQKAATTTAAPGTKNCYGETVPFSGATYPATSYLDQNRVIDQVIQQMKLPVFLMDISMLSALRKDGHPSIYGGDLSPSQRKNPDRSSDCSHWCLPGLPDTWNQLFYAALLS
ncbi:PREDICTED: protein trichome birefringence-like 45 [Tarenaya hassleriana]|uniref:protein trichome birefringence-like 45 n=1 Tax=Tarenaya hassleriana TaxID=28532 RepID=UPI00053C774F|nr:PREDICTED: protein trichome birefringence-like 45 [Tarenaya hassleriana]